MATIRKMSDLNSSLYGGSLMGEGEVPDDPPWYMAGPQVLEISDYELSQSDMSTETDDGVFEPVTFPGTARNYADMGPDYWEIRKLMKYLKTGDNSTTRVSLIFLQEYDFSILENQLALLDCGALEVFVNITETNAIDCKLAVMVILTKITETRYLQSLLLDLGFVVVLVELLTSQGLVLLKNTLMTLCNMVQQKKARTIIRKKGGIKYLVDIVDSYKALLPKLPKDKTVKESMMYENCLYAIKCLTQIARSPKIRELMYSTGIIALLMQMLQSPDPVVTLCGITILMLGASLEEFRDAIESYGMMYYVVQNLNCEDTIRIKLACRSIFKLAVSEGSRSQVVEYHGLDTLVNLVKSEGTKKDIKLLKYSAGATWRLLKRRENLLMAHEKNMIGPLIAHLDSPNTLALTYVAGILAELTRISQNRSEVYTKGGVEPLMELVDKRWDQGLLENVSKVLGDCALVQEGMVALSELDGIRAMWSLLKAPSPKVQANASWALVPLVRGNKDSGELIRSFVGGLDLLVRLLQSPDDAVKAGACAAIATVAFDAENLSILTELGIVKSLCDLTGTSDETLRENLGVAIANCSATKKNCFDFGRLGCIAPMVGYLGSKNIKVVVSAAFALWKLSSDPINCITLHKSKVVPFLLECMRAPSEDLQKAAGGCLINIRVLAHEADQIKNLGTITGEQQKRKSFSGRMVNRATIIEVAPRD